MKCRCIDTRLTAPHLTSALVSLLVGHDAMAHDCSSRTSVPDRKSHSTLYSWPEIASYSSTPKDTTPGRRAIGSLVWKFSAFNWAGHPTWRSSRVALAPQSIELHGGVPETSVTPAWLTQILTLLDMDSACLAAAAAWTTDIVHHNSGARDVERGKVTN
jgi:hypothetical protein